MTTWTGDKLNKMGRAEESEITSPRRDGTLRHPVKSIGLAPRQPRDEQYLAYEINQ
jgi:hypothetical protein